MALIRLAGLATLCALATSQALATGNIDCTSTDGEARINLLLGSVPGLGLIRTVFSHRDQHWSTEPSVVPGTLVLVSQALAENDAIAVDFVDEDFNRPVARLRLLSVGEAD